MTTLAKIAQNKKQQARAAFIDAAWAEEAPDSLAALASDAVMEPAAADAKIARIAEARADMHSAGDVVRLRRTVRRPRLMPPRRGTGPNRSRPTSTRGATTCGSRAAPSTGTRRRVAEWPASPPTGA